MRIDETRWTKAQVRTLAALLETTPPPWTTGPLNGTAATACRPLPEGGPGTRSQSRKHRFRSPASRTWGRPELLIRPLQPRDALLPRPAGTKH